MGEDNVVEFMIFALCFLFLIMFLDITPFIQAANPSFAIQPTGCTPIAPGELFPLPTRNFYAVTQEFTDLSEHQEWYFGPWYLFSNSRGICPWSSLTWNIPLVTTAEKVSSAVSNYGATPPEGTIGSVKYCWRPKGGNAQVGALTTEIFSLLDSINAAASPPIASNLVGGYSKFRNMFFLLNTGTILVCAVFFLVLVSAWYTLFIDSYSSWARKYKTSCVFAFISPMFLFGTTIYWIVALLGAQRALYAGETTFAVAAHWQAVWPQCTGVEVTSRGLEYKPGASVLTQHPYSLMMALVVTTPVFLVPLWVLWIKNVFFGTSDDDGPSGLASVRNFYKFAPYAIMGWSTAKLLDEDVDAKKSAGNISTSASSTTKHGTELHEIKINVKDLE